MGIAVLGTCAYLFQELLAPFLRPRFDYRVRAVNRLNPTTLEVVLAPVTQPLSFVAGQFVFDPCDRGASRVDDPLTISSRPPDRNLRPSSQRLGADKPRLLATRQAGEAGIGGGAVAMR